MLTRNGIKHLSSTLLSGFAGITHGFLSRTGGVSKKPFDSLNFDLRDGDTLESVGKNLEIAGSAFAIPVENLTTVNQVHGNTVFVAEGPPGLKSKRPDADAVITAQKNIPAGILTADCLPVLLFDPENRVAAAVHAGWKGTAKGVTLNAIEAMRKGFGSDPKKLTAALGPYIGPCCYSVRENVLDEFKKEFGGPLPYFQGADGELRLDIGMANVGQLLSAGVAGKNIDADTLCTSCCNNTFFSYRKDGGRTGRQLSFIMLR